MKPYKRPETVLELMYWTAKMTKGVIDSGLSEYKVSELIENEYKNFCGMVKAEEADYKGGMLKHLEETENAMYFYVKEVSRLKQIINDRHKK